jgi:cysteinyl-tRNA synthetase
MLKIYNTISKEKQVFIPNNPQEVNIYVCGVTVYDYCHLGHARLGLFFDTVIRYLKFLGYKVNFIRNITDIDDKILNKAKQSNQPFTVITEQFTRAMQEDFAALNLLKPSLEPKATEFIDDMITLIKSLISNNNAYVGKNGDIFYNVTTFNNYGMLSKCDFENMQHTERVEKELHYAKSNPQDFVLWKLTDPSEIGWQSPWGYGRPGWHTECAAMSLKLFGKTFDIHGGAIDLIFPHHENEIAQVEPITKNTFVNYWMHIGFLQFNKEKMSKSLGNFTLIKDVLKKFHPEVLRYFMLSSNYRSQIEFSDDKMQMSKNSLESLYISLRDTENLNKAKSKKHQENYEQDKQKIYLNSKVYKKYLTQFTEAINDDFNTPLAISLLFKISKELNIAKEKHSCFSIKNIDQDNRNQIDLLAFTLKSLANAIGLLMFDPEKFLCNKLCNTDLKINQKTILSEEEISILISQRNQARQEKNWALADSIREQLDKNGILLEDREKNTVWRNKN